MATEQLTNMGAIRRYFGDSREVTTQELRQLSQSEREELGALAAKELGVEILPARPSVA